MIITDSVCDVTHDICDTPGVGDKVITSLTSELTSSLVLEVRVRVSVKPEYRDTDDTDDKLDWTSLRSTVCRTLFG